MSLKFMIVDDSPFSRTMMSDMLKAGGYEVVGEADSLETALATYEKVQPDIVTMDIAMPKHNGFDISKALLHKNPQLKIILSSSMKDEDMEQEARRLGISGYIQKPVEEDRLYTLIEKIMAPDTLFDNLMGLALPVAQESLSQNLTSMIKQPVSFSDAGILSQTYLSRGITAVIGIIGQYSGTLMIDVASDTAASITQAILKRKDVSSEEVIEMSSELANIIAGRACSMLNKQEKSFGLQVSPPSIFHGKSLELVNPCLVMKKIIAHCDYGEILLSIGFKRGKTLWM